MNRNVQTVIRGQAKMLMEGRMLSSPLPAPGLRQLSPFLMLDHMGPVALKAGEPFFVPPHPHKGFEPVTIIFEGDLEHKDSAGNHGLLTNGDVQWMTAGKGIVHSEGIQPEFQQKGGRVHFIQLWINLPRSAKQLPPAYQDIRNSDIPTWTEAGMQYRLIAGEYGAYKGPAHTHTPIVLLHGSIQEKKFADISVATSYNVAVFVTKGVVRVDGHEVEAHGMAVTERGGDTLRISGEPGSEFLLMAGLPIDEPVASYGPFVMNNLEEIQTAIWEYETGKMGSINF